MGKRGRRRIVYTNTKNDNETYLKNDICQASIPYSLLLQETNDKILEILKMYSQIDIKFDWLTLTDIHSTITKIYLKYQNNKTESDFHTKLTSYEIESLVLIKNYDEILVDFCVCIFGIMRIFTTPIFEKTLPSNFHDYYKFIESNEYKITNVDVPTVSNKPKECEIIERSEESDNEQSESDSEKNNENDCSKSELNEKERRRSYKKCKKKYMGIPTQPLPQTVEYFTDIYNGLCEAMLNYMV